MVQLPAEFADEVEPERVRRRSADVDLLPAEPLERIVGEIRVGQPGEIGMVGDREAAVAGAAANSASVP